MLEPHDIRFCLDKALEMEEAWRMYAQQKYIRDVRSTDEFQRICRDHLGKNISVKEVPESILERGVMGVFMPTNTGYEIYLLRDMNLCWNRFVLTKELFHMLLDNDEYRNTNVYQHLVEYVGKWPVLPGGQTRRPVACELLAQIAAMQFLYPFNLRKRDRDQKRDVASLAEQYKVPLVYVESYLSDGAMENLGAFSYEPFKTIPEKSIHPGLKIVAGVDKEAAGS